MRLTNLSQFIQGITVAFVCRRHCFSRCKPLIRLACNFTLNKIKKKSEKMWRSYPFTPHSPFITWSRILAQALMSSSGHASRLCARHKRLRQVLRLLQLTKPGQCQLAPAEQSTGAICNNMTKRQGDNAISGVSSNIFCSETAAALLCDFHESKCID